MPHKFKGIFTALTTPFIGEKISPEKLRENIQKFNSYELSGYVILGSTGECVYLSNEESEKLVKTAKESASPEKMILVGTARESTLATLEFTNRMADLNIDAALVRTPSYFKSRMDYEALKKHYLTVADHSRVPILIYNVPANTGISIPLNLLIELSRHPNIAGIKESSGNLAFLGEAIPQLNAPFDYLLGAGNVFLSGLHLGACGGILALANVAPAQCINLYNLFLERNFEEALKVQLNLIPLNNAIIQAYGIPATKYALDLLGYYGGSPRPPLLPLSDTGKREIENILRKLGLLKE